MMTLIEWIGVLGFAVPAALLMWLCVIGIITQAWRGD